MGLRITFFREKNGMNQSDLVRDLEKDRQTIQKLQTGKVNPTIRTLHQICEVLKIEITDLLN
jgi:DNA-binding XRE family transcriptional regulator